MSVRDDEIKKIVEMKSVMQDYMVATYNKYQCRSKEVVFTGMIIKKSIDIISVAEYAFKNNIITVQISLLRLLCDNCLAIESAHLLGLDKFMELIMANQRPNQVIINEETEETMSDGYLKRMVAEDYPGFDRVYKFACEGVHFSKQTIKGTFGDSVNGSFDITSINFKPGNPELKEELVQNNKSMITICKIIIDMLKRLCM
ncbi:MAG: hypothetical protein IJS83_01565 [Acholeplasmatales bacterium]|nr:hypothetical protein [Acholeplasmatales bacterium]